MRNKDFWIDCFFWVVFLTTAFLFVYKSSKDFRVFLYNAQKDTRLFIKRDLPRSPATIQRNVRDTANDVVESVEQVPFVYNQVSEIMKENTPGL